MLLMIRFGSVLWRKRKSLLLLVRTICSPRLIRCAFIIMSDSAAWRKIFTRRTAGKTSVSSISRKTAPGPTEGSWSTSPTRISLVPTGIADRSAYIREMSTIDISSMIMTSASSGFASFLSKRTFSRSSSEEELTSSSLWIVEASYPVVSVIRLAARPVGAARRIVRFSDSK